MINAGLGLMCRPPENSKLRCEVIIFISTASATKKRQSVAMTDYLVTAFPHIIFPVSRRGQINCPFPFLK